jgi:hypothetical protein
MRVTFILFNLFFLIAINANAQVVIGSDNTAQEKQKKPKKVIDGNTAIYLLSNWSNTNRVLTENKFPFGKPLGEYENETAQNTWSFGFGISNKLNDFMKWEGGISYLRNGEQYSFSASDSAYSYKTTYSYIGMPLKLIVNYGKTINFFGGVGIIPQLLSGYQKDIFWKTNDDSSESENLEVKQGYAPNSFVLSTVFNIGFSLKLQDKWAVFVSPEYRLQLNSTFDSKDAFIHKGRAFGVSFGLIRNI